MTVERMTVERMTGIELAYSAWEALRGGLHRACVSAICPVQPWFLRAPLLCGVAPYRTLLSVVLGTI